MSPKTPRRPNVPTFDTRAVGARIGIDWPSSLFDVDDLRKGILVELEHSDVTGGDLDATAKIAWAHLRECPDYYDRLAPMEKACKAAAKASPELPSPGWGKPYGDTSYITREGTQVWLFRKGQRCRFYDLAGRQVGPEQDNVAPAVAMAMHEVWRDVSDKKNPYSPGTLAHVFEQEERNPAKGSGGFDYKGFHIGPFEGTSARPSTLASAGRGDITGGHRKERGFLIHLPDGGTKFVSTQKRAKEYIDNYLGDEQENPASEGWSAPYEISKLGPTASFGEEGRFFQTLSKSEIIDLLDDQGTTLLEPSDGDAYQGPIELKAKSSYDDMLGTRTRVWVRVPIGKALLIRVADEGKGNPEYEATFGAESVSVKRHRENPVSRKKGSSKDERSVRATKQNPAPGICPCELPTCQHCLGAGCSKCRKPSRRAK